jgi:DNA-binding GntR family transcriptional regulator
LIQHIVDGVVSLSHAELIELYEIRESLEGMACRLAAERMTDAEIEELRQVLHTHERDEAFQAGLGYYQQEGDFDFHYRIIQGAGNRTLTQTISPLTMAAWIRRKTFSDMVWDSSDTATEASA